MPSLRQKFGWVRVVWFGIAFWLKCGLNGGIA